MLETRFLSASVFPGGENRPVAERLSAVARPRPLPGSTNYDHSGAQEARRCRSCMPTRESARQTTARWTNLGLEPVAGGAEREEAPVRRPRHWKGRLRSRPGCRGLSGSAGDQALCTFAESAPRSGRSKNCDSIVLCLNLKRPHCVTTQGGNLFAGQTRSTASIAVVRRDLSQQKHNRNRSFAAPDLGRALSESAKSLIAQRCPKAPDIQVVIGDGLFQCRVSHRCLSLSAPPATGSSPRLVIGAVVLSCATSRQHRQMNAHRGASCARVIVLLIGERPGLATAESLSPMAYSPRPGNTDADRNPRLQHSFARSQPRMMPRANHAPGRKMMP